MSDEPRKVTLPGTNPEKGNTEWTPDLPEATFHTAGRYRLGNEDGPTQLIPLPPPALGDLLVIPDYGEVPERPDDMPWNWCPECDGPAQCPAGTCCGSPFPEGWTPEEGFMIHEGCWCGEHGIRHKRNGPNCVAPHRDDEGNHDFRTCPCASCDHLRAKVETSEREEASQPERQWSESTGMRYCRCRSVILMPGFLASERGGIEHSPERCRVLKETS